MIRLFTYGTLMCEDIMFQVAGNCFVTGPATLRGYRCATVKNETYPAIFPHPDSDTTGVLYESISDAGIARLDEFEGEMYLRKEVRVTVLSQEELAAFTYVFRPEYRHLLSDQEWSFDRFLQHGKQDFVEKYVGFSKIE